jgi:hypothetical protein
MLVSHDAINSQKQLESADIMARRVGSEINRAKIEFMMVGQWELRVSTRTKNLVKGSKYLGSRLLNCAKDFEIRKALA